MVSKIEQASEQYRNAVNICRNVFDAAKKTFVEPKGVLDHIQKARELYRGGDEALAVKEVENARQWLNGVAAKFLRNGGTFFEGRIKELSYMSLDRDIMEQMEARMRDYCAAIMLEGEDVFELRVEAYRELAASVNGAQSEQQRRIEHREQVAHEQVATQERERQARRREQEEQDLEQARARQAEAEAAARVEREKQFDELFG